jgi:hypothetical protein
MIKLSLEPEELVELKAAIRCRIGVLDGLVRRAPKKDKLKFSRQQQHAASIIAKINQLEGS